MPALGALDNANTNNSFTMPGGANANACAFIGTMPEDGTLDTIEVYWDDVHGAAYDIALAVYVNGAGATDPDTAVKVAEVLDVQVEAGGNRWIVATAAGESLSSGDAVIVVVKGDYSGIWRGTSVDADLNGVAKVIRFDLGVGNDNSASFSPSPLAQSGTVHSSTWGPKARITYSTASAPDITDVDTDEIVLDGQTSVAVTGTNLGADETARTFSLVQPIENLTTPLVESGDVTQSGSNTAQATWAVSFPSYVAGDLLIFHVASDANVTHDWPATGPNGETINTIVDSHGSAGTSAERVSAFWFIGSDTEASGSLTVTPSASEQWVAAVLKVPVGEFDPDTPIDSVVGTGGNSSGTGSTAPSPAWSASAAAAQGRVMAWIGIDADPVTATPSGWLDISSVDIGAVSGTLSRRTAAATASESIASATWSLASDSSSTLGYVILPPPEVIVPQTETGSGTPTAATLTIGVAQTGRDIKFGAAVLRVVTGGQADSLAVTVNPASGQLYIDVLTPNTTAANRITASADIANGDQIEARGEGGGAAPTGLILKPDATFYFSDGNTPANFDVRVWDTSDQTWGAWATQSIASAAIAAAATAGSAMTATGSGPGSLVAGASGVAGFAVSVSAPAAISAPASSSAGFAPQAAVAAGLVAAVTAQSAQGGPATGIVSLTSAATGDAVLDAVAQAAAALVAGGTAGEAWVGQVQAVAALVGTGAAAETISASASSAEQGALAAGSSAAVTFLGAATAIAQLTGTASVADAIAAIAATVGAVSEAVTADAAFTQESSSPGAESVTHAATAAEALSGRVDTAVAVAGAAAVQDTLGGTANAPGALTAAANALAALSAVGNDANARSLTASGAAVALWTSIADVSAALVGGVSSGALWAAGVATAQAISAAASAGAAFVGQVGGGYLVAGSITILAALSGTPSVEPALGGTPSVQPALAGTVSVKPQ